MGIHVAEKAGEMIRQQLQNKKEENIYTRIFVKGFG